MATQPDDALKRSAIPLEPLRAALHAFDAWWDGSRYGSVAPLTYATVPPLVYTDCLALPALIEAVRAVLCASGPSETPD